MGRVPSSLAGTPYKWLGAIGWPEGLVVEAGGVPYCFVGELGHADGMRGGTGTGDLESAFGGAVHVALVVGGVYVFPVPAAVGVC